MVHYHSPFCACGEAVDDACCKPRGDHGVMKEKAMSWIPLQPWQPNFFHKAQPHNYPTTSQSCHRLGTLAFYKYTYLNHSTWL